MCVREREREGAIIDQAQTDQHPLKSGLCLDFLHTITPYVHVTEVASNTYTIRFINRPCAVDRPDITALVDWA